MNSDLCFNREQAFKNQKFGDAFIGVTFRKLIDVYLGRVGSQYIYYIFGRIKQFCDDNTVTVHWVRGWSVMNENHINWQINYYYFNHEQLL